MVANNVRADGLKSLYFIVVMAFLVFLVGGFLGTAGQGFSDPNFKERYSLYFIFGISSLLIIGLLAVANFVKGKEVVFVPVHDPEDSLVGSSSVFVRSPILFSLVCLWFAFGFSFFFAFVKNTFFSSVPQAVSGVSSVWSQAIFPLVENPFFYVLCPLVLLFFVRKWFYSSQRLLYWVLVLLVIPLISAFGWMFFHNLVYGALESAQVSTFVFGFLWVFVTNLFMSQISGLALHFAVNFAVALNLNGELASDWTRFWLVVGWIILLVVIVLYYKYLSRKRAYA